MLLKDVFKKTTYIPVNQKNNETNYNEVVHNENAESQNDNLEEILPEVPEGLLRKCEGCGELIYTVDVEENNYVCTKCGHYFRIDGKTRISMILDKDTFEEKYNNYPVVNPLNFPNYEEKIKNIKEKLDIDEGVVTGIGKIYGNKVGIGVCDTRFLMGSMGHIVGEKITNLFEMATEEKIPVILFTCSGGARMQEGIISLMQMAKTAQAIKKHSDSGLLYITVLTDPTTGGVTASFAMLGDIILAEPKALIGFAGPRVIKQTIGEDLPEGFQKAEFLLNHGFVDSIVKRESLRKTLDLLIKGNQKPDYSKLEKIREEIIKYKVTNNIIENYSNIGNFSEQSLKKEITVWERIMISRSNNRPTALDYINIIFKDFYELHGDRQYGDDGAIVGGIGYFGEIPVTIIGQQKGKNTKENIVRNFGMPHPEGYRKAKKLMEQAEKFNRPIVCFIDTKGAYCGVAAEERGQGEAIARNLYEMSGLSVPVLSIFIGEGGSGGAISLAVANEVWMLENSTYSILSPEGFAAILWKDSKRSKEAADIMKITSKDLLELGVIDRIIPELEPANEKNIEAISMYMKRKIYKFLKKYQSISPEEIKIERYNRFRKF